MPRNGLSTTLCCLSFILIATSTACENGRRSDVSCRCDSGAHAKQRAGIDPAMQQTLAAAKLATQVAAFGRKYGDPAALLVAARIVANSPVKPLEGISPTGVGIVPGTPRTGGADAKAGVGWKGKIGGVSTNPLSYSALREEAAKMGDEQERYRHVLGAMDPRLARRWAPKKEGLWISGVGEGGGGVSADEAARPTARCHAGQLRAGQLLKYSFTFKGSQPAMVSVIAADGSSLACSVRDASLAVIEQAEIGSECLIAWTPTATGRFQVQIQHKGEDDTGYTLCIN